MKFQNQRNSDSNRMKLFTWLMLCSFSAGFFMPVVALALDEDPIQEIPLELDHAREETISMSFDGALLKDALLLFSQQSGLNFIASQEVENKKVTVYFEDVSPNDALNAILTANGLTFSKKPGSDIYIVYPAAKTVQTAELITKVIPLKYMRLSTSPLDVGGQETVSALSQSAGGSASSISSGGSVASTSSSSTLSGSSGSSAERGADNLVRRFLSTQGKMAIDSNTNSLIITDTAESIATIEKILSQVDVPPSQVILEVYIMEVQKSLASDIGVQWGGDDGALGKITSGRRSTPFPFTGNLLKPLVFANTLGDSAADPSTVEYGMVDAGNLKAVLRYIQTDTKTRVLARPRVLTQNNEAAAIKLVTNAGIGTTTVTTSGGSGTTSSSIERAEIGVSMRMTPQINEDDTVLLFLEPAISTVTTSVFSTSTAPIADPTTRSVRTMARVKNDQTLVIGGLIDGQGTVSKRKMPLIGDLPGIGKLFSYDIVDDVDRELLIFVTPHIVRGATSLGDRSATARGEDLAMRSMLDKFMDKEIDSAQGVFDGFEKTKRNFFSRENDLVRASERRYSNPVVERQINQAMDALSPQIVDRKMSAAMDSMSLKK